MPSVPFLYTCQLSELTTCSLATRILRASSICISKRSSLIPSCFSSLTGGERSGEKGTGMEQDEKVRAEALEIISLFPVLPRLVVFDLDYTFWPYDCDHYSKGKLPYPPYPHATGITRALKDKGIDVAIASRSPTPDIAKSYLEIMGIQSLFLTQEIFLSWTPKTEHFKRIGKTTGIPFNSMLFFDDDYRNTYAASKMGVTSVVVEDGVNLEKLRLGLSTYATKFASSSTDMILG